MIFLCVVKLCVEGARVDYSRSVNALKEAFYLLDIKLLVHRNGNSARSEYTEIGRHPFHRGFANDGYTSTRKTESVDTCRGALYTCGKVCVGNVADVSALIKIRISDSVAVLGYNVIKVYHVAHALVVSGSLRSCVNLDGFELFNNLIIFVDIFSFQ